MRQPATTPHAKVTRNDDARGVWFFDETYGDHSATYTPVDPRDVFDHWVTEPARLTCDVTAQSTVWAVFRRQRKYWIAREGSDCALLGRWSDGTVRLQVGLVDAQHADEHVSIDGRFPAWVAQTTRARPMLRSNVAVVRRSKWRYVRRVLVAAYFAAIAFETAKVFGVF